jgi:pimeloyl-ACP methyl ester carboxylesterase
MDNTDEIAGIIQRHERTGSYITVEGIKTFVVDQGTGPVVFCIHGVPTSSFLYRKITTALQQRGLRVIVPDLPGLGLTERPEDFDYRFTAFGTFSNTLLDVMNIAEVHLVVHDIGAPVGFAMAAQKMSRIKSITVLNAMLDLKNFTKPLAMRPFEIPLLGEAELATLTPFTFPLLMKYAGVDNMNALSKAEMGAYIHLLKRKDEGKAFLKIMRQFEKTEAFTALCYSAFKNPAYPVQLIWGMDDPFLPYDEQGKEFEKARPGVPVHQLKAKHFLQEEKYEAIAKLLKAFIQNSDL